MEILKSVESLYEKMVERRRHIHENPELSAMEDQTCEYIVDQLKAAGFEEIVNIPNGGVIAWVRGGKKGKTVMLRADIDALPLQESPRNLSQERTCISKNPGVMHACGHDAHTAMLLTAGEVLLNNREELNGDVLLVFERGEEGGGNIRYIVEYFLDNKITYDVCYGMHVNQNLETGRYEVSAGPANAGNHAIHYRITGRGGHSSRPDMALNPIDCMMAMIREMHQIRMKHISPFEQMTLAICKIQSGTKSNIIPETAEFEGTMRYYSDEFVLKPFEEQCAKIVKSMEETYGCKIENLCSVGALPLNNDKYAADIAVKSAANLLGEENVGPQTPIMGSESYPLFFKIAPGCYGNLGIRNEAVGSGAEIHNPLFDLDEKAMITGAGVYVAFAVDYLNA